MPAKKFNPKNVKPTKKFEAPVLTKNEDHPNYIFIKEVLGEPKTLKDFANEPLDPKVFYVPFYDYFKSSNNKNSKELDLYKIDFNNFRDFTSFDELISTLNEKYISFLLNSFEVQDKKNPYSKILTQEWSKPTAQHVISNYILNSPENQLSFFGNIGQKQDYKIQNQTSKVLPIASFKYDLNNIWVNEEWKHWLTNFRSAFFNEMDLKTQQENFITKPIFAMLLDSYNGMILKKENFKTQKDALLDSKTAVDFFEKFKELAKHSNEPFFQDKKIKQTLLNLQTLVNKDLMTDFSENNKYLTIDNVALKMDVPTFALLAMVINKYFELLAQGFKPEIENPKDSSELPPPPGELNFEPVNFLEMLELDDLQNLTIENVFEDKQEKVMEKLTLKLKMKLPSMSKSKKLTKA